MLNPCRLLPAALSSALLAFVLSAAAASAAPVTTSHYSALSTSGDISLSCCDLQVSANGTLSAKCNKLSDGQTVAADTPIDMTDHTDCTGDATNGDNLAWATSATFSGNVVNPAVSLTSKGTDDVASGQCQPTGGTASPASTLDLSDTTSGLENDAGGLTKR